MDQSDEKQMEGVHASPKKKISRDYLPVTQVELSRCIVGRPVSGKKKKKDKLSRPSTRLRQET